MAEQQNEYGLPIGKGEKRRTARLLPRFYRTESNKKFIQATIDQLTQSGTVKKLNGFIGRQNAKAATDNDVFIESATTDRQNYQLEPSAVVKDTLGNVTFFKDYIDYINTVDVLGGVTNNHQKLNKQEFYSWNPHINWDKFVNFQQYYWMPYGPASIKVFGQQQNVVSTYTVKLSDEGDNRAYVFTPDGLTRNPTLKLYRGQTYKFEIDSPGEPFSIKTQHVAGDLFRYQTGVDLFAVESGTITFTIPVNSPNVLYFVSENSPDTGGALQIFDIDENSTIDVDVEIIGKKTYTLSTGVELSNGMKLTFGGNVYPELYASGAFYVEGVGEKIKLIPENDLEIISSYSASNQVLFDDTGFDSMPFSDATAYANQKDYITINRSNSDGNPWSRYNRWFHQDVISKSAAAAGIPVELDQTRRATRPIIEFESNLKLFNFGYVAKRNVDLIDTYTKDVFSTIEGSVGYNIDGIPLAQGQRILFTADTDSLVNNKIFKVTYITVTPPGALAPVKQIHLVDEEDIDSVYGEAIVIRSGNLNQGKMYWYNGTAWKLAQQKTAVNQNPLFDLFDADGVSISDTSVYPGTTFVGNTIFSYKKGSGLVDDSLGFSLSYRNINNIGDIVFTFDLLQSSFSYKDGVDVITKSTDSAFLKIISGLATGNYTNGWITNQLTNVQPIVRVFKNSQLTNNFPIDVYSNIGQLTDLEVRVYVNGKRIDKSLWSIVDGVQYKKVVFDTTSISISLNDVITLRCFSSQNKNKNGFYELPINLQNNPLNNGINTFTLGEVIDHVDSIVDNLPTFNGTYPGSNNLRDQGALSTYGTKFVQHSGSLNFGLYHLTSKNSNIIKSLRQARDDYGRFKRNFISVATKIADDLSIKEIVDKIILEINKDKPKSVPYYFSDMVGTGASTNTEYEVVDYRIKTYPLSAVFSLDELSNKAVNIYVNGTQLIHTKDYAFDSTGFVIISDTFNLVDGDIINVYEYESTDGCFIPPTPTSFGIWPKFEPKKYLDTTLVTPQYVIQGHDGSIVVAYNDYRDDLILEIEKRIFNNIKVSYNSEIFDIFNFIPGYSRSVDYGLAEFNKVLAPSFYQWSTLVDGDFTKPMNYNNGNPFTYNYSNNTAPDGSTLPGYWRGIYKNLFDTDRIHLCPWESLGLSIEPTWWQDVYGSAPYTSDNLILWNDLKDGITREPGKPLSRNPKFARPTLATMIPVNDLGELLNPIAANIVQGDIKPQMSDSFEFGDYSPVESTWRRSSFFPFSFVVAVALMQPNKLLGTCLDRSRIIRSKTNQLVYKETGLRLRLQDLILPSIPSDSSRVLTAGLVNYIVDYILSDNLKSLSSYKTDLTSITNQLSHRLGGFTSKEKFNLILDSKSPTANAGVFIPQENYSVFLNTSSPIKKLTYSGVVITKILTSNSVGYEVRGYNQSTPFFYYYPWTQTGNIINVGGISESYIEWSVGQQYIVGNIVRYNNAYYRASTNHTSQDNFDSTAFQKLAKLPIIGGREASLRKLWDRTPTIVNYGAVFESVQEVVDFLQGYGEFLKDQGFVFDDYNTNLKSVASWETSVKEFMFWTTQNWSTGEDKFVDWLPNNTFKTGVIVKYNGEYFSSKIDHTTTALFDEMLYNKLSSLSQDGASIISLSPSALGLSMRLQYAVIDDVRDRFNEYEILKADGSKFDQNFLNHTREDNEFSFSPRIDGVGIYGAGFYLVQKEHVLIIDNSTQFNDTIYNLEAGYKQDRIKVSGYRTVGWYGGFDIPGFVFDQAIISEWQSWTDHNLGDIVKYKEFYYSATSFLPGVETFNAANWVRLADKPSSALLPNWDYKAEQFTDFYDLESDNFDAGQQKIAQHLIGYQKRQYLENIIKNDVSEYKFYQGMISEKGSSNSLNKLFDVLSAEGKESIDFNEEWAVRVGQYGGSDAFDEIEILLSEPLFKTNPQAFELTSSVSSSIVDFVIRQTPSEVYLKPTGYNNHPWPELALYKPYLRTAGHVRYDQVKLNVDTLADIVSSDITALEEGDYVWTAFEGVSWNVYRYTLADFTVRSVEYTNSIISLECDGIPSVSAGDIIGITNAASIAGFHVISSVDLNVITIAKSLINWEDPFADSSQILIYKFLSQRVSNIDSAIKLPLKLKVGELLWAGLDGQGSNSVWQNTPVFTRKSLSKQTLDSTTEFGRAVALNSLATVMAVSSAADDVSIYVKSTGTTGWSKRQTLSIPLSYLPLDGYGKELAFSPDGVWLAVGAPDAITGKGRVMMYQVDANGEYQFVTVLLPDLSSNNQYFGSTIKIAKLSVGYRMAIVRNGITHASQSRILVFVNMGTWAIETSAIDTSSMSTVYDIDMSNDGSILIVADPLALAESGQVHIFNYTTSSYELDQTIDPTQFGSIDPERFGESVSITSDGTSLAVGSILADDTRFDQGVVRVFKITSTGYELHQVVKNRNPETAEKFGAKVKFINSGKTLAIFSALGDSKTVYTFDSGTTTFDVNSTYVADFNKDAGRVDIYDAYESNYIYGESLSVLSVMNDKYGYSFDAAADTIIVSAPKTDYLTTNDGVVYTYTKIKNSYSWMLLQTEAKKVNISKIKKLLLYNKKTSDLVTYLDIIDPMQGKVAGIAEQEIKFKTYYDPATYSVGTESVNVDDGMAWLGQQVGTLWWDLTRAKFLDSYTGDIVYRNSMWNTLYETGSIDVYEWVETKYTPTEWNKLADTEIGLTSGISGTSLYTNENYSVKKRYDSISKTFKNTYYFWVKNKTTLPNIPSRSISAKTVAALIADPKSQGHKFVEFIGTNSFSLVNVQNLLVNTDIVLAAQYWLVDQDDLNIHTDWKIISEHPNTSIPSVIESKWIDSLVGSDSSNRLVPDINLPPKLKYGVQSRPRQSMFVNRIEALKQYIERLNSVLISELIVDSTDLTDFRKYDIAPTTVSGMYDLIIDTDSELRLVNTGSYVAPSFTPVIKDGRITEVIVDITGSGYTNAPYITINGFGTGAVLKTILNVNGGIASVTVIEEGIGYTASTSLYIRPLSVLVSSDEQALGRWSIYAFNAGTSSWLRTKSQSYNVPAFWNYVDWYSTGYNLFTKIDYSVNGTNQLYALSTDIGQTVKVKNVGSAGWMLLEKFANVVSVDYTQSYKVIGRQNGTIQISNKFYQFVTTNLGFDGPLYDADVFDNSGATELRIILNAIKDKVLIDELRVAHLQLFFASVRYALSEQPFVDWVFKTSFVKAMHNVGDLKQKVTYNNDNLEDFEKYIAEVKPYRTKIREYVSSYNSLDNTQSVVTDFDLPPVADGLSSIPVVAAVGNTNEIVINNDELLTYPWKHWLDNASFYVSEIVLVDGGLGYIGNPEVIITGANTVQATAKAYVSNGKVTKIQVITSGTGYFSAPTVELNGGLTTTGVAARAVAFIKNDLVRSALIKIKFDRITSKYYITSLNVTEEFSGTGSRLQFPLKWSPDLKTGKTTVIIKTSAIDTSGQEALRDTYSVTSKASTTRGHTSYSGLLTFKSAPANGEVVVINYVKDFNYLSAADRIQYYYDPISGQVGKDLSQLMTGVDYGGVNVVGLNFKSSAGWDDLPWFTDVWDGYDPTFDDYIITVGDSTYTYTLPYVPAVGQEINIYVNGTRIDDPYFDVYDGSTVQPNGRLIAAENAVMNTFVGDGVTDEINLPNLGDSPSLDINTGDRVIFRKSTSDGALTPSALDYDTELSGGNLAYSTATGLAAEDILIDGDGFVTTTSSPAPEEVVPGQITDAVAVKVFHRSASGSARLASKNYIGNGVEDTFSIGQYPNTQYAVTVRINGEFLVNVTDFTINYDTTSVTLNSVPTTGSIVSVSSFGFNGQDILDLDYFVGNGTDIEFITKAPWVENASSLVIVSGQVQNYILFRTDNTYEATDRIGIKFGSPPVVGAIINYLISSVANSSYSLAASETITGDGSTIQFPLNNRVGDALPLDANVIVRLGQRILSGSNNTYYTLKNNQLTYLIPAHKFQTATFNIGDFDVFVNGTKLRLMLDYTVDLLAGSIVLNLSSYVAGGTLVVSIVTTAEYTITSIQDIEFVTAPLDGEEIEIVSHYNHDILDIQRSEVEINPIISLTRDTVEYFEYNKILGGLLDLGRDVLSDDYVWVIKNGTLLTHSVDYILTPNKNAVKLTNNTTENDILSVITFTKNVVRQTIGYMQFKDMLNRDHYKRLSDNRKTALAQDLNFYDSTISVVNGSVLNVGNKLRNLPGIIYVGGERIEFFTITGNVLGQLRRGTLGTGTPAVHSAGEMVVDIGISETIPYNDDYIIDTYIHDGTTNIIPLQYIPKRYPIRDPVTHAVVRTVPADIEIFVGGYNIMPWTELTDFSVGEIVLYGSSTFRCVTAHKGSSNFTDDRTNWEFFVGNQRLKKHPYSMHNVENHWESTDGDVSFAADFSVDETTAGVTLLNDLSIGTKVIIIKKVGKVWYDPGTSLVDSDNKVANFIKATEGIPLAAKNPSTT
jgi:hypothetical protein